MDTRVDSPISTELKNRLFIGGRWVDPAEGGRLAVINPATEETFHEVAAATAADVNGAVTAAREAFPAWGSTTGTERAAYLHAIAEAVRARREELARMEVIDNGKPLAEALWDIDDTAGCFEYYAELAVELDGRQGEEIDVGTEGFRTTVHHEPVGVAGQIIPWNYPMLMAAWKLAPALAAGATCVLKPSELTPLSALEYGTIAQEIDLPAGVLNILTGTGADAGAPLTQHPDVDKLAFTGSVPTGMKVMTAAAQDIKNVSLELGGKSPFIVFEDADVEQAVEWIMFGIFWNQGEVCSATSRLIIHEDIAPAVLDRLKQEAQRLPVGNGLDEGTLLGPLVSEGQYKKVLGYIESGLSEGATLLTGGGRPAGLTSGYYLEPTVFVDVQEHMRIWREEIFGPVLCVKTFSDEAEALRMANETHYGLAGAVMSADLDRCERVAHALRAGIIWINCSQPTFTQAPWGGMKQSGIGRELGRWGLNSYIEVKQITRYEAEQAWGWYIK